MRKGRQSRQPWHLKGGYKYTFVKTKPSDCCSKAVLLKSYDTVKIRFSHLDQRNMLFLYAVFSLYVNFQSNISAFRPVHRSNVPLGSPNEIPFDGSIDIQNFET